MADPTSLAATVTAAYPGLILNPSATPEALGELRRRSFPVSADYEPFLALSDGGETELGTLQLWTAGCRVPSFGTLKLADARISFGLPKLGTWR